MFILRTRALQIWDKILAENPDNKFTEKQVYHEWTRLNEKEWKLDSDQVKSAEKLIRSVEDYTTMVIPITQRPGIHTIAFGLKEPIEAVGAETLEVAMDSTCKSEYYNSNRSDLFLNNNREDQCSGI